MNRAELMQRFPKASESFLAANADDTKQPDAPFRPKRRTLKRIVIDDLADIILAVLPDPKAPLNGNAQNHRPSPSPEPKQALLHAPDQPPRRKAAYTGRVGICVESFRKRLIDPDNLCPKYFIDGLRYAGIISDDSAGEVEIVVKQTRVYSKEEERTEITLTPISS